MIAAMPIPHATDVIRLYGISNCDTVRKARAWLSSQGASHVFHDFRKDGLPADALEQWLEQLGWETLLNRKGTTWRQLDEATRSAITSTEAARRLMLAHPSVIKRPVVEWPGQGFTVGLNLADWETRLQALDS